jgi:hypothetical protein
MGETGGSVLGGGISVFGEMLDTRFIGDDASLGKARPYMLSRITVETTLEEL